MKYSSPLIFYARIRQYPRTAPRPSAFGNDCNQNGVADAVDVANGTSIDCNQNGWPDECDLGFDPMVTDSNANLIPDECEADANSLSNGAAACGANGDRSVIANGMVNWWANYDWHSEPGWRIGYAIKMKFLELGFDLRMTMSDGAGQ